MHRLQELVRLYRLGTTCHERARLLCMSPNTERPYREAILAEGLLEGPVNDLPQLAELRLAVETHYPSRAVSTKHLSSIAGFESTVQEKLEAGAEAKAIFDFLRQNEPTFQGSLSAVKRMCRRLKKDIPVSISDVVIGVETAPGEIAQVDFGFVGKHFDPETGQVRRTWAFVMVLCFSRKMYVEFVHDQKIETWIALHQRAFEYFGGVVKTVVPDNLKAAVIRAAFTPSQDIALNRTYRELAKHYGFTVDPTPPYSPKKKGKVERSIRYLKSNFMSTRKTLDTEELRQQLIPWTNDIANVRIHGTTQKKPDDLFLAEEVNALRALPAEPYDVVRWHKARVHRDSHIMYQKRLYSVPWKWIGKNVWVQATAHSVCIFGDDERIATHSRRLKGRRITDGTHLPPERSELRYRCRSYWEERAKEMSEIVLRYIQHVFDSDDVLSKLRDVQAIIRLFDRYPKERADAACMRADHFGAYKYKAIRNILEQGLDMKPFSKPEVRSTPFTKHPAYSRSKEHFASFAQTTMLDERKNKNEYH